MIYLDHKFFNYQILKKDIKETLINNIETEKSKGYDKDITCRFEYGCENRNTKIKRYFSESGFFNSCYFFDSTGLYSSSSLCNEGINEIINNFNASVKCTDILDKIDSKFKQSENVYSWEGVVLALQQPNDMSIRYENGKKNSEEIYFKFVEDACKKYKNNLFLKVHPWNSESLVEKYSNICNKYGCKIGRVGLSVIKKCKFVLLYNSGFSIDCLIHGVNVAQYSPGFFYRCDGINYTNYTFPDDITDKTNYGYRLCDFLMWKYCTTSKHPADVFLKMLKSYSNKTELFPLEEQFSYGGWLTKG